MKPFLIILLSFVVGCAPVAHKPSSSARPARDLPSINYAAVDRLVEGVRGELPTDKQILVASLVDLDDLRESTTLGRLISEQIGSRLAQEGFTIKELKLRGSVLVQQRGGERDGSSSMTNGTIRSASLLAVGRPGAACLLVDARMKMGRSMTAP